MSHHHEINLADYRISGDRLVALAQEFSGELHYLGEARDAVEVRFTPIEGFPFGAYDLQQRFLRALQDYREPPY